MSGREPVDEEVTSGRGPQINAQLTTAVRRYLNIETRSAVLLLAATVIALVWVNSPWAESYHAFWSTPFSLRLGAAELELDLAGWVNDGLMVFFFYVVGLEVKQELTHGEFSSPRRALVPLAGAIAGLVVPAALFLAFNPTGEQAQAWGVVISTDTAFVLGVLAIAGPGGSTQVRVFLLALAVIDDIGALTIVGLFYSDDLSYPAIGLAAVGIVAILLVPYVRGWRGPAYLILAIGVWLAMYASGIHPTLAGVAVALCTPAHPPRRGDVERAARLTRAFRQSPNPIYARQARLGIERSIAPAERLQQLFQPWTSYVVLPIFALANAGVVLDPETLGAAFTSRLTLGIIVGLVVGKFVGVSLGTLLAKRLRPGSTALSPGRVGRLRFSGAVALTGIGFTISLFIVELALEDPRLAAEARVGILAGSAVAALLGWLLFRIDALRGTDDGARPRTLVPPVDPETDHIRGPMNAPLTLVEYGDFECPFCGRVTGAIDDVRAYFGERLRYVFRHLPLTDVHPRAEAAARAAEAAAAQSRFWEMHDMLFRNSSELSDEDLLRYADELGLDVERFDTDLEDDRIAEHVRDHAASAEVSGVRGTPTFFVQGRRHKGPHDAIALIRALEAHEGSTQPPPPAQPPDIGYPP